MTHLNTQYAPKPTLTYPFIKRWSPAQGRPFKVAEGVYWLRQPLPIALDHINLWILKDGDGWTVVDSGFDHPQCKQVWEQVFTDFLNPESVNKLIITHFHPDHIGLAAWLAQRCDCRVLMSRGEFDYYRNIVSQAPEKLQQSVDDFVTAVGFTNDTDEAFRAFFAREDKPQASRVTDAICDFVVDQQQLEIGGATWRVITGNGHSPEHVCLYSADKGLLISGDQAIARISSNVGVYPGNLQANPLDDWLNSCKKLQSTIANDALILPAHQEPFIGIDERMQQLIDDHNTELNRLRVALQKPLSVAAARQILFDRELDQVALILATGETLAHLNYLMHNNEVLVRVARDGQFEFYAS